MSCPICKKPTETPFRPFCSKRCADVDLGRWFNGNYAIPTEDVPDPESHVQNEADAEPLKH